MDEESLFAEALLRTDAAERASFLDAACVGCPDVRLRVELLLRAHERSNQFLEKPALEQASRADLPEDRGAVRRFLAKTMAEAGNPHSEELTELDKVWPLDFLMKSEHPGSLGRLGRYDVLGEIGGGATGIVLRARDPGLDRIVALKVLPPSMVSNAAARRRFSREARAAAAVCHEHVVTIHAVEDNHRPPFLVMEYINGGSLQDRLKRDGPLGTVEVLRIGAQAALGLAAAHAQGLVHRDVKPANILLEEGMERVKLTDFGLARAVADASETMSGVILGTPSYMAPEQAEGRAIDHRADLFALGAVLYACFAGCAPFRAESTLAVLRKVCDSPHQPLRQINPDVPEWLGDVIDRLLSKNPDGRYASANDVAERLTHGLALTQQGLTVPREPRFHDANRPKHRRWLAAAAIFAVLAGTGLSEATGITKISQTVIRLTQPDGTLVIESADPGVKVDVGDEELVVTAAGSNEIRLRPGRYELKATRSGKLLKQELVQLERGGRQVVRISHEPANTTSLSVSVDTLRSQLQALNPEFNGEMSPTFEGSEIVALRFVTDHITDLSPLRALHSLRELECMGMQVRPGMLSRLDDLKGLNLTYLAIDRNPISDLSPLAGMKLTFFSCFGTKVSDLSTLAGMPLRSLRVELTPVADISPLRGSPLADLNLSNTQVRDLEPLRNSRLEHLNISRTKIADISPLKNGSLIHFWADVSEISDLTPIERMPLEALTIENTRVKDLTPLKTLHIAMIRCDPPDAKQAEVLRGMPSLKWINNLEVKSFWQQFVPRPASP